MPGRRGEIDVCRFGEAGERSLSAAPAGGGEEKLPAVPAGRRRRGGAFDVKVVITDYQYDNIDAERRIIGEAGFELKDYQVKDPEGLIPLVKDADAIVTQYSDVSRRVIEQLDHCKMIIKYGIGVNNIDTEAATERGIYVCNVPDYGVEEVSDHAVTMMLALGKKMKILEKAFREGDWGYSSTMPLYRLCDCTLGLVGFGRIPQLVAKKMGGIGLRILAYDPFIDQEKAAALGVTPTDLDTILRESDFISVHVPLNESTRHLIGEEGFRKMKKTAFVVNTARGGVIDEKALVEALLAGQIAGAGVDVYEEEPVKPDNPLLHMDNVIATPHCAWYSETAITALQRKVAEEVVNVLKGNEPFHCVNRELLRA